MSGEGDHRHCKVCGRVCPPSKETCSAACQGAREQRLRTARNYRFLLYATVAVLLIVLLASYV